MFSWRNKNNISIFGKKNKPCLELWLSALYTSILLCTRVAVTIDTARILITFSDSQTFIRSHYCSSFLRPDWLLLCRWDKHSDCLFFHKMHIETAQQDDTINEIKEHFVPVRKKKTLFHFILLIRKQIHLQGTQLWQGHSYLPSQKRAAVERKNLSLQYLKPFKKRGNT